MSMKKMPAGEFKARCLTVMEDVNKTREPVLITKRGKPVAKLVPVHADSANLIGSFKGKIKIKGNILSTGLKWNAES